MSIDGFAQVQPPGYIDGPDLRKAIAHPAVIVARMPFVTTAAPRATTYEILSHGSRSNGAALFGVDAGKKGNISTLPATLVKGRFLRAGDAASAVVGDALARNLKLSLGDHLTVLGSAWDGTVAAIPLAWSRASATVPNCPDRCAAWSSRRFLVPRDADEV